MTNVYNSFDKNKKNCEIIKMELLARALCHDKKVDL